MDDFLTISEVFPPPPPTGRVHFYVGLSDGVGIVASGGEYFICLVILSHTDMSILNILVWWPCRFTGDEMLPAETIGDQFIIKVEKPENWDRLSEHDLHANEVIYTRSSHYLEEVQERLRHKRYIRDVHKNVRAAVACCRPPDCVVPGICESSGDLETPCASKRIFPERRPPPRGNWRTELRDGE